MHDAKKNMEILSADLYRDCMAHRYNGEDLPAELPNPKPDREIENVISTAWRASKKSIVNMGSHLE